jgi:hypothetical protein
MENDNSFWTDVLKQVMAIPAVGIALMGALGGATNALVVRVNFRQTVRYILLGAMCAAGSGQMAGAMLEHWGLMPSGIAQASTGAVAFFAGLFFPALFEVILSRISAGKLPTDKQ